MPDFIVVWVVMTITFVILTQLPLGIEADNFGKTAIAALIFGFLHGLTDWLIKNPVLNFITIGFFFLIGNTILFALSAYLVKGFRLRWGIVSAVIGALSASVIYSVLSFFLTKVGLISGLI